MSGQSTIEAYNTNVSYGSSPEEHGYPLGTTDIGRNSSSSSGGSNQGVLGHHSHGSGGNSADESDLSAIPSANDPWEGRLNHTIIYNVNLILYHTALHT